MDESRYSFLLKGARPGSAITLVVPSAEKAFWIRYGTLHPEYDLVVKTAREIEGNYGYLAAPNLVARVLKDSLDARRKDSSGKIQALRYLDAKRIVDILRIPFGPSSADGTRDKEPSCLSLFGLAGKQKQYLKEGLLVENLDPDFDVRGRTVLVAPSELLRFSKAMERSSYRNVASLPLSVPSKSHGGEAPELYVRPFADRMDEVHWTLNEIGGLLSRHVDPETIFVHGADEEAARLLEDLGTYYGIPIEREDLSPLSSYPLYQDFLHLLQKGAAPAEALEQLRKDEKRVSTVLGSSLMAELDELVRDFRGISSIPSELHEVFRDIGSSMGMSRGRKYKKGISLLKEPSAPPGSHVFFISCDLRTCPRIHPRGGLLSEEEKARLSMMTAEEEDQEWLSRFLALKERGDIAAASYAQRSEAGAGFCTTLLPEKSGDGGKEPKRITIVERSLAGLRLRYHTLLDEYVRFGYESKELSAYRQPVLPTAEDLEEAELGDMYLEEEVPFSDYKYEEAIAMPLDKDMGKRIPIDLAKESKLTELLYPLFELKLLPIVPCTGSPKFGDSYGKPLSPSSLEDYYSCPFLFFSKNVLSLDPFESSFYASFGNIVHAVFEKLGLSYSGGPAFDFGDAWDTALKEETSKREEGGSPLSALDRLLLRIEKEHVESIVLGYADYFDHLASHGLYIFSEGSFEIPSSVTGGAFALKGRFDAVLSVTGQEGERNFVVVDYKTGSYSFSLDRYKAGLSLQLPIYAYWGKKDGEVVLEGEEKSRILSPDDRLLGMFIAHVYDSEFPREAKGDGAAYQEVTKKLKFQGPFDPAILDSPFVFEKGSASWIVGIKPSSQKEKKAGAPDWKIASPGEVDLSADQIEALASPVGIEEEGGSYLPSVPEVAALAEALISGWAFPIAPLCLNIDAIEDKLASEGSLKDDDDEDGEEEEGGDSSAGTGKKGRKKLSFLACDNCSFRDVCYVRRDYFRRFGPDFQKKDFHQGLGKIEVRGGDEDA